MNQEIKFTTKQGFLCYGPESGHVYQGVKESSRLYKIPVNELDIEMTNITFALGLPWSVLYEPHAGLLDVEKLPFHFKK